MDFDDLDDEIENRIQAGETVTGYVVQNHQPRPGDILPLMKRTNRLPGFHCLPDAQRRKIPPLNGEKVVERKPVLRLLCVHGVADSLSQDWYLFEDEAPPDIEVAMHEFPGHGHREKEPICGGLDELADDAFEAFREAMDTGTFALLGHSIGCLIVTKLAKRAREELGVEPVVVFMVERGACQFPLFTEKGYKKLHEDPLPFMAIYQPAVVSFYNSAGAIGQRTLDMWQKGWFCENETLQPGYHTFNCPLKAMFAEYMVRCEERYEDLDVYKRTIIEDGSKFFNKKIDDEMAFTGHFPYHSFEEWVNWTEFKDSFKVVECKGCDHMSIKSHKTFKSTIFDTLRDVIKLWSAAA
mmetsp:Transcript_75946/g.176161  ORF Transcript_75946/g.176161 Transcript_75946/m.176161 type:complete len:353 (+) Transcript_75946:36-1094(+)|eukprot:CAMPEP_0171087672 /NCGR_PEP_ID=MMETSP0766_2-20121228/20296_1 /TAXON_ID=439317 /ORGANISM="Gambierdiscus australes, Strain CAWD 149" /LENGTH=352 /DNA_ID=CAMNT_0011545393 /DNA_START=36 /DNA_END=1094 /DNA_ORIENTATION=-